MSTDLLIPAQRQYLHNDGSGFVIAYDETETNEVVKALLIRVEHLKRGLLDFKERYPFSPWITGQVDDTIAVASVKARV